jgi:hypothetical protein
VDVSIIPALAALTGAAVGGLTSGIATWLNQRNQVRADAAKCYIDALRHDEADIPGLVGLYAKLSAMRGVFKAGDPACRRR